MWELAVSPFQPTGEMRISPMSLTGREERSSSKLHEAEGIDYNQPDIITLWRTFNISS